YPEYYVLKVNKFNDIAKDSLDEWIYFLKHNVIKENFKAKGLEKAREVLDRDNLTSEERSDYDYLEQIRSENRSMIFTAKYEGEFEERKKREKVEAELAEKEAELTKREAILVKERAEKERALAEKERALAEKERALAEKEALATELAALKADLR
ncbi:MAG: hypothetical protein LBG15_09935, partial [Dysgonamonadaceae bacterium]|nr:hypothetical protein [Dysgonamonadaceae bacterium]